MNKKTYLSPETVSLRMEVSSLMQNASQSPFAEAKQHNFSAEEGPDDYEDDNPWERVAHPEDLWK
jgi:hypothetical protein